MPDLLLIINDAGMIECINPAAAAAFGYSVAELIGTPWQRILDRSDPPALSAPPAWQTASSHPILLGIHRDGRRIPLRLTRDSIPGSEQTHYVLSLQDAHQPLADDGRLLKHHKLYELATRHGRISVWEVDYRMNHLEYSPVLAQMLGLSEADVPRDVAAWQRHFHPDDWRVLEQQADRLLRREIPEINLEMRMLHQDGSVRWGLVRATAFFDEQGRPIKTLGTTIDITQRKKAEQERDLFFDISLDLLCISDLRGFRRVNPQFSKTLGYTIEELTSRPFLEFVHPDDVAATKDAVARLAQGEDIVQFENRYRCKDGTYRWLSWKCPAPKAGSDTVFAVARDVTEARLAQAKLEQAIEQADRANRAKSEFLSRMSHELRTPLNAVLGFGQLLQRETLTPRQAQHIDLIVKGGRHLLTLINEVLDITRIEVGRLDLSLEPIDLAEMITEVVSLTAPMAHEARVQIAIDQASVRGCFVQADQQRLKQVLLNLLSNAIKYNRADGQVAIRCEAAPSERVRIHVRDTGTGIPLDKQDRLFTPFDRLGAETTAIEGSGLGLVLSRRLAEIMEGTLTFVSEPGLGSTFTIDLAASRARKEPQHERSAAPSTAAAPGPERVVLCIEDNLANVKLMEAVLAERTDIRLLTALQGRVGLDLARQHHPDLILLDIHLSDMKGEELLIELRADPQLTAIPVVVISADATAHQTQRLLKAGAKEYLTKPLDVDRFLGLVDRLLKKA